VIVSIDIEEDILRNNTAQALISQHLW